MTDMPPTGQDAAAWLYEAVLRNGPRMRPADFLRMRYEVLALASQLMTERADRTVARVVMNRAEAVELRRRVRLVRQQSAEAQARVAETRARVAVTRAGANEVVALSRNTRNVSVLRRHNQRRRRRPTLNVMAMAEMVAVGQ